MLKDTIKKLRTEQGLSQDELAERVHVVRQTVSKWERGTSVPDADSLVALARALGVSAAELLGESAMVEKKPDDLAWETSLLDERITSESQRLDRLVRALKWALVGAAVMVLVSGLFIWLPNQQFSYTIWWDSVTDAPDYNKIIYRLDGEEKSIRLFLDPENHGRVIGCAGEPGMAEAMSAAELLNEPGSLDALSERANQAIEAMGGIVLRHELWLPAASREDDDPTNDDIPYSVCFYADSDDQDIPWL
ncbi:helix-turn-helix domain-containing protein [Adlercreutzia sp.]|uniref:helix-turn-helix domain-containing protein n=1 Tax=Adlercreutzia sp. TaxID=1872387 RepID=UPI003AF16D08